MSRRPSQRLLTALAITSAIACACAPLTRTHSRTRTRDPVLSAELPSLLVGSGSISDEAGEEDEFELEVEGVIMLDGADLHADSAVEAAAGRFRDDTEDRRVEVELEGHIPGLGDFEIEYDFSGKNPDFKDVYLRTHGFWIGQFKEPFGLEVLTESKHYTFMERGLALALAPTRSEGLMHEGQTEAGDLGWAVGVFKEKNAFEAPREFGDTMVTGRVVTRVKHDETEENFTHLGLALSRRWSDRDDSIKFSSGPESHLSPSTVSTGSFKGRRIELAGVELAHVNGPFSVQSEWIHSRLHTLTGTRHHFSGAYLFGSWFLTGEHRGYDNEHFAFDRVEPIRDFQWGQGGGAWEVAARYSTLDLNSGAIKGGELSDWTLGVNWYLSSHTRWMINAVRSHVKAAGRNSALMLRFQIEF